MNNLFHWLDANTKTPKGKLANQLLPILICTVLYVFFVSSSRYFIDHLINPTLNEKISLDFHLVDVTVGFFLYFVTAIDYALIVGRMQISNPGAKARVTMNIATVIGCYIGVTAVLFLWGFAKEVFWLIIPILIFAGSVMIKLSFEGIDYFENSDKIPELLAKPTVFIVDVLNYLSRVFTFWMPEIAKPSVEKMKTMDLAKWSLILPFIIGLDDLVGYMGAMTIYNAFGLLIGIYFADVFIDVLIFASPDKTKRLVESPVLSFIATYAFLYLAYKSYSEAIGLLHEDFLLSGAVIFRDIILFFLTVIGFDFATAKLQKRRTYISHIANLRS